MKKSDLKTGHRVRLRDGSYGIVMRNTADNTDGIIFSDGGYNPLDNYEEDLMNIYYRSTDIIIVYGSDSLPDIVEFKNITPILWERKDKPVCTLDGVDYSEETLRSIIKKATT